MLNKIMNSSLKVVVRFLFCVTLVVTCQILASEIFVTQVVQAQERLPIDNTFETYHPAPRYRESESHPLRIVAYAFHPIGWFAREIIFRPFSYFVSSNEKRASIFGYRDPHDTRKPLCYTKSDTVPNCKALDVQSDSYNPKIEDSEISSMSDIIELEN